MRALALVMGVALCVAVQLDAHKPVTSKYTFSEDVFPIVKEQCGGCHVSGGIAPMSLMTYEDARPWAESIRLELTSGHMPPWYGDPSVAPLRDVHKLSPRDLDVVLTWVTVASELSATVVLYSGPWRTMTVVMFQALEGSGAGIATAAASTLIVVTLLPIVLLYRLVRRYELSMS